MTLDPRLTPSPYEDDGDRDDSLSPIPTPSLYAEEEDTGEIKAIADDDAAETEAESAVWEEADPTITDYPTEILEVAEVPAVDDDEADFTEVPPIIVEDDGEIVQKAKPAESPWERLRALFSGGRIDSEAFTRRLLMLDQRIADEPEAAGNYVLRGELFLQARDYERAYADFQRGLELARAEYASSDWGLVAQAMQDRALQGLEKAAKKLSIVSRQPSTESFDPNSSR